MYFIGNALSQVMSLVLLRFVTGKISSEEYGFYNLIVTIDNLITPIFTLQIGDALFRYFIKAQALDEKKKLYTSAMIVVYLGGIIMATGFVVANLIHSINHIAWVIVYLLSTNLFNLYSKIIRSMGKNKVFATVGFAKTLIYILMQMILLFGFDMGGESLFISTSISTFIAIIAIEILVKPYKYFDYHFFNFELVKKMVKFSGPLIPNTMLWWLCSSVNSVIVSLRLGLDVNGIYSVSSKFSNILIMVTSVFSMAWQESAIKEYDNPNFKKFQTETFNTYIIMVLSGVTMLIPFVYLVMPYMIDSAYYDAIQYVPFLLASTAFSTFSGYTAQILTAQERTKSIMYTSICGMLANVIFVFLTLNIFGLWSAVFGSLISNILLTVVRIIMVRKSFDKNVKAGRILLLIMLIALGTLVYSKLDITYNLIYFAIVIIICIFLNKQLIVDFAKILTSKFSKKGVHNE